MPQQGQGAGVSAASAQVVTYAEEFLDESSADRPTEMRAARERAADLGINALSHQGASLLELLSASVQAQAVIEVGTGVGVSGASILAGMTPGGVLTSIDLEAEYQRYARALVDFKDSFISFGQDKRIMPYFILEIVIQETNTQNRKSRLTTTKAP